MLEAESSTTFPLLDIGDLLGVESSAIFSFLDRDLTGVLGVESSAILETGVLGVESSVTFPLLLLCSPVSLVSLLSQKCIAMVIK